MGRGRVRPSWVLWGATLLLLAFTVERALSALPQVRELMKRPPAGAYHALFPFIAWLVPNLWLFALALTLWSLACTWGMGHGTKGKAPAWLWAGCLVWLGGAVLPVTFAA